MLARYLPLYVLVQSDMSFEGCFIIETKMKVFLDIETKHFNNYAEMLGVAGRVSQPSFG